MTFAGPAPDLDRLDGIKVERAGANTLRFAVAGGVAPLLRALASCNTWC